MRLGSPVLLCLPLCACSDYLGGSWEGEWSCVRRSITPAVLDLELDLTHHGLGDHSGEFAYATVLQDPDATWRHEIDATYAVELFADGTGDQELTYDLTVEDFDCKRVRDDGSEDTEGCGDEDEQPQEGDDLRLGAWTWDGSDEIELSDEVEDCEGVLER